MPGEDKDSPDGVRSSSRKRVPSARILEAEADKNTPRRKRPKGDEEQGDNSPTGTATTTPPHTTTTATKTTSKSTSPKSTPQPKPSVKSKGTKSSAKKSKTEDTKLETKLDIKLEPLVPYILVILVHVDRQGNSTEFWTAPRSKISSEQLEKLAACHHGALNDDEDLFREIFAMLVRNFEQLDEIYFEKPKTRPVQVNQLISEVYQMHFGDFGASGDANYDEPPPQTH